VTTTSANLLTISRLHFKRGDNMEKRERVNQTACISLFPSHSPSLLPKNTLSMEQREDEQAL